MKSIPRIKLFSRPESSESSLAWEDGRLQEKWSLRMNEKGAVPRIKSIIGILLQVVIKKTKQNNTTKTQQQPSKKNRRQLVIAVKTNSYAKALESQNVVTYPIRSGGQQASKRIERFQTKK